MKKNTLALVAFSMTVSSAVAADWTVFTNVTHVRRLYADSSNVYAVTSGGFFRLSDRGHSFRNYNSGDGLGSNDLRDLARDGDAFWTGGAGGVLTRLSMTTDVAQTFPLALGVGSIEALERGKDTLWVGTDIGVGLFLAGVSGGVLKDMYTRLGTLPAESAVNDLALFNNDIFAATPFGVVSAERDDPALHIASQWTTYADPTGALARARQLAVAFDSLWVASDDGLFVLVDTEFVERFSGRMIRSMYAGVDTLWLGTDSGAYYRTADTVFRLAALNLNDAQMDAIARVPGGDLWVGIDGAQLVYHGLDSGWFRQEVQSQPVGVAVAGLSAADGRVWCAHLGEGAGYLDTDGLWRRVPGTSASRFEPLYSVKAAAGRIFYPGWGQGIYLVSLIGNSLSLTQYDASNSLLEPVTGSPTYTVVAGIEVDAAGGFWAANRKTRAPTLRSLVYFPPSGTPQVTFDATDGIPDNDMTGILLVGDRLWIGYNGGGLGVLDFAGTPGLKSDDQFYTFTSTSNQFLSQPLPSDFITTLDLDRGGFIWVGTPGGLARIDPEFFPFMVVDLAAVQPASSEILSLVADAGNQLWVGTGHGLARIPNGELIADSFWFAGATPLPDNRVWDLALDPSAASIWIGTGNGLANLAVLARDPANDSAALGVFPSPLHLRSDADFATFQVPFGARIDIFTVAGDRVRTLVTSNTWDGRNEAGQVVATGLYLIRVTYADGSTASGRLGVVRER